METMWNEFNESPNVNAKIKATVDTRPKSWRSGSGKEKNFLTYLSVTPFVGQHVSELGFHYKSM